MINPEAGQMWFRVVIFIILISTILLFSVEPGSAAFVATVLSLIVGLIFLAILVFAIRRSKH